MKLLKTISDGKWGAEAPEGSPVWYCMLAYREGSDDARNAGFRYHGKKIGKVWTGKRMWWTHNIDIACELSEFAVNQSTKAELSKHKIQLNLNVDSSRREKTDKVFPSPEGLTYRPYQSAGVEYMIKRDNTLLGDDMGLGKTIQAIGLYNSVPDIKTCLVVCPKTLCLNWKREFDKWNVKGTRCGIADTKVVPLPEDGFDIIIINYEAAVRVNAKLARAQWDLITIDEAHHVRNPKNHNYRAIFGDNVKYRRLDRSRLICATGTPINNRPMELWGLLKELDPVRWNDGTYWEYRRLYCAGSERGASSNAKLNELQKKLRSTVMIRRLKDDVEKELPKKIRQVVELQYDPNDEKVKAALAGEKEAEEEKKTVELLKIRIAAEVAKADENEEVYNNAIKKIREAAGIAFHNMALARKNTALAKIPYAVKFINEMSNTVDKIVIFSYHRAVIDEFMKVWPNESKRIYGGVKPEDRQDAIDSFQNNPKVKKIFVAMKAGSEGVTLTASSTCIFVEEDWTPSNIRQCEDRLCRIGATGDHISVIHLVLQGSIDVNMAVKCIDKQNIIDATLDTTEEDVPLIPTKDDRACTKNTTRKQIEESAKKLDVVIIPAIQQAIRYIASMDSDRAMAANGVGFNAIDSGIGHNLASVNTLSAKQAVLAQKIIKKYGKQLPAYLYAEAMGIEETF